MPSCDSAGTRRAYSSNYDVCLISLLDLNHPIKRDKLLQVPSPKSLLPNLPQIRLNLLAADLEFGDLVLFALDDFGGGFGDEALVGQ